LKSGRCWSSSLLSLLLSLAFLSGLPAAAGAQSTAGTAPAPAAVAPGPAKVVVEVFVREGCPNCAKAKTFLDQLARERPDVAIVVRDVQKDAGALARLKELARTEHTGTARVPAFHVGGELIVGFSEAAHTDRLIRDALAGRRAKPAAEAPAGACEAEEAALSCEAGPSEAPAAKPFELEFFGRTLTLDDVGLPAFTLAMGLLDGFNPCSMWVLILMISLLAPLNDRRRMLAIAGTFVAVEGVSYFVMMAAWLNLFLLIGLARWSEIVIGLVAVAAGAINMKDFWAYGRGVSLSIPDGSKPGIYARMRGILHAENMGAAIVGTIVLGLLVQIVEFLCTSGFPALFTRILTLRELDSTSYYGYLLLYNAAYMLDDVIILAIGVVTLSRHRLQEKEGRWLKLLSGVVMVGLGLYLLAGQTA
jgi:glutaredoxin